MKVILDNNVFISGVFWTGATHKIIKLAEKGKIEIFTSLEILEELFDALQRKKFDSLFKEAKTNREEVFGKILELVKISPTIKEVKIIKEDPEDDKFLACAIAAQASFIISGDKHLLKLKKFQGVSIVSVREFLKTYQSKKSF